MTHGIVHAYREGEELLAIIPESTCRTCGAHRRLRHVPRNQAAPADTWRDVLLAFGVMGLLVAAMYALVLAGAAYWVLLNSRPIPAVWFGV